MQILAVIPARYASSRFPGKPLIDIKGKTMIERVYERVAQAVNQVVVATDDERIADAVKGFGGQVAMTSASHQSGTDRCAEAVAVFEKASGLHFDVVLNIQGDEPLIDPVQVKQLADLFQDESTQIATLIKEIHDEDTLFNPDKARVIKNVQDEAIYFTRHALPFVKGAAKEDWLGKHTFYQHIGLYGYRKTVLQELVQLPQSSLELMESLEQLRWIENGYKIKTGLSDITGLSIDTPEDLEKLVAYMEGRKVEG